MPKTLLPAEKQKPVRKLPPNGPGEDWAWDWLGRPVNLWGLRKHYNPFRHSKENG